MAARPGPAPMNDKCNLSPEQQKGFGVNCPQTYPGNAHQYRIRLERHLRGGGLHPEAASCGEAQSGRLVARRPARRRLDRAASRPGGQAGPAGARLQPRPPRPTRRRCRCRGPVFNTQSHDEFIANWDRQAPCPGQYDQATPRSVWSEMLESDPVGAAGSRRCAARPSPPRLGLDAGQGARP